MNRHKRPALLSLLSLWLMVGLLLSPLYWYYGSQPEMADALAANPQMGAWHGIAVQFGPAGVGLTGFALLFSAGIVGVGLWRYQEWSRVTAIAVAAIDALWCVYEMVSSLLRRSGFNVGEAIGAAMLLLAVAYLQSRKIRSLFKQRQVAA